jgi:hypothetical protein
LEEGRVGQWLTGLQHIELDALGAGLGKRRVPRPDLDGNHKVIVPGGRDTSLDQGSSPHQPAGIGAAAPTGPPS